MAQSQPSGHEYPQYVAFTDPVKAQQLMKFQENLRRALKPLVDFAMPAQALGPSQMLTAGMLVSPPPIGGQTPNSGAFTALSAKTLALASPVPTPAAGQIGAGDAAWTGLAYSGAWVDFNPGTVSRSIKDAAGHVSVQVRAKGGVVGQNIGTLPAAHRPGQTIILNANDLTTGVTLANIQINPAGIIVAFNGTSANGIGFDATFPADA